MDRKGARISQFGRSAISLRSARITETLRVLLFMTLSILVFSFYPVTAVMIVMLALLNDGAILSIAYDNVHYKDKPEAWNMHMVPGVATVLGVAGVASAFGLFYRGERVPILLQLYVNLANMWFR